MKTAFSMLDVCSRFILRILLAWKAPLASGSSSDVMMVSHFTGDDGVDRLEAVFN